MIETRSLREQVYEYLQGQIQAGHLVPGTFIKLNEISAQLGVSKTPLRDALIQMECEGFVSIIPRRGVLLKRLTLTEIREILQTLGALESATLRMVFELLTPRHLRKMAALNDRMRHRIQEQSFDRFDYRYYSLNLAFHAVFLELSANRTMNRLMTTMKQQLYDFPRLAYIKEWEWSNCDEHARLIRLISRGDKDGAAIFWQETHWGFEAQEPFIRKYYAQENKPGNEDGRTDRQPL